MEPILNLFNCFNGDATAGEVKAHLEATGQCITQDGYGNLSLEIKRQRALCFLDTLPKQKWVSGPTVLRGGK